MRSSHKSPKNNERMTRVKRSSGARAGDADSQKLAQVAKAIGNQNLGAHLESKSAQRDNLLAFICMRLQSIHDVQAKERNEMSNEREWFREVAKGVQGFHLPDPKRWHECTKYFQRAAMAMCAGHVGRGVQLLQRALEAENAAFESIPKQVEVKLDENEKSPDNAPGEMMDIDPDACCPSTGKPQELQLADRILNISDHMEPTPPLRFLHWWTGNDQEEEEDEDEADE